MGAKGTLAAERRQKRRDSCGHRQTDLGKVLIRGGGSPVTRISFEDGRREQGSTPDGWVRVVPHAIARHLRERSGDELVDEWEEIDGLDGAGVGGPVQLIYRESSRD